MLAGCERSSSVSVAESRARDTQFDRDVTLKVLPEAFTSDPDRLARERLPETILSRPETLSTKPHAGDVER